LLSGKIIVAKSLATKNYGAFATTSIAGALSRLFACAAIVRQTQRQKIVTTTEITSTFMASPLTHLIKKAALLIFAIRPQRQPQTARKCGDGKTSIGKDVQKRHKSKR